MNILFVTLFALETNTSVTKSNYNIIDGLIKSGNSLTLLMPEIDCDLSYYDNSLDLSKIKIKRIKNNNIGQKIAKQSSAANGWRRTVISFARNAYSRFTIFDRTKALITEAKNFDGYDEYYDVVISTSDPKTSHLFVKELINNGLKYGKWIQHWGDPLAGDISKNNLYPDFIIEKVEKDIISQADRVVYVSPFTLDAQKKRYKKLKDKFRFVPLPCDDMDKSITNKENQIVSVNKGEPLRVVYLGDYNSSIRNIRPLYEACEMLDFLTLTIAGNTDITLEKKKNINIMPRVSQIEAKRLENEADVIVSVGNLSGSQIPGKIYYAASSSKAILVTIDGEQPKEMKQYLESYNRFICCLNNTEDITGALIDIRNHPQLKYITPKELLSTEVANKILL